MRVTEPTDEHGMPRRPGATLRSRIVASAVIVLGLPLLALGWLPAAIFCFFLGLLVLTSWSPLDIWWNGRTDPDIVRIRDAH